MVYEIVSVFYPLLLTADTSWETVKRIGATRCSLGDVARVARRRVVAPVCLV